MPELVTCPACGFRTQMADSALGRTVRCGACAQTFTAGVVAPDLPVPPAPRLEPHRPEPPADWDRPLRPQPTPLPAADRDLPLPPEPRRGRSGRGSRGGAALCPWCHRPVGWDDRSCPLCGGEFEGE